MADAQEHMLVGRQRKFIRIAHVILDARDAR
jgi:hypothetical protein